MLNRFYEFTQAMSAHFAYLTLKDISRLGIALFGLLTVFILRSRRMNARLEAPAPAPRRLQQWASALTDQKSRRKPPNVFVFFLAKAERPVNWLLRKTDWLLYDRLKLLPDAHTGQRINFFLLFYAACYIIWANRILLTGNAFFYRLLELRDGWITHAEAGLSPNAMWLLFVILAAAGFVGFLPMLLLPRKNGAFYLDAWSWFMLLFVSLYKLFVCWPTGCCFGIVHPWGVYNARLGTTVFPVQLFEFATGIPILLLCAFYILYAKSYRPGRGFAVCVTGFAVSRFFWEFFRYHGESIRQDEIHGLFGMTMVQTVCVALCILAVLWLIWLLPLEKKLMDRFRRFITGGRRGAG